MKKSCDNCLFDMVEPKAEECDDCYSNGDSAPTKWRARTVEPELKPQTGYAFIPMDEYLDLFVEIGELRKENAGLKAELETTKRFLSEATAEIDKMFGGE